MGAELCVDAHSKFVYDLEAAEASDSASVFGNHDFIELSGGPTHPVHSNAAGTHMVSDFETRQLLISGLWLCVLDRVRQRLAGGPSSQRAPLLGWCVGAQQPCRGSAAAPLLGFRRELGPRAGWVACDWKGCCWTGCCIFRILIEILREIKCSWREILCSK